MSEFKFNFGDFVVHTSNGYNKMIVISRYFEEYSNHMEEKYVVSRMEMGQLIRVIMLAEELVFYKEV